MRHAFFDLAFTPAVQAQQVRYGSREGYAGRPGDEDEEAFGAALGPQERAFIESRDGFYLASVSETGWPYVQFRGGPAGFLRVLGSTTLGWADFRGNRQYVSVGNTSGDPRVAVIAMDYARRARLKILGRLRFEEALAKPDLVAALVVPDYRAKVERVATIEVAAFDWNCPQHITPRFREAEIEVAIAPLHARIAELEARLAGIADPGKTS